jgi:hypothetical protein
MEATPKIPSVVETIPRLIICDALLLRLEKEFRNLLN